jgi:hypothetical protein
MRERNAAPKKQRKKGREGIRDPLNPGNLLYWPPHRHGAEVVRSFLLLEVPSTQHPPSRSGEEAHSDKAKAVEFSVSLVSASHLFVATMYCSIYLVAWWCAPNWLSFLSHQIDFAEGSSSVECTSHSTFLPSTLRSRSVFLRLNETRWSSNDDFHRSIVDFTDALLWHRAFSASRYPTAYNNVCFASYEHFKLVYLIYIRGK